VDFSLSGEQLSYLKYHNIILLVIFYVNCIKSYNFDDYGLQLIKKIRILLQINLKKDFIFRNVSPLKSVKSTYVYPKYISLT